MAGLTHCSQAWFPPFETLPTTFGLPANFIRQQLVARAHSDTSEALAPSRVTPCCAELESRVDRADGWTSEQNALALSGHEQPSKFS